VQTLLDDRLEEVKEDLIINQQLVKYIFQNIKDEFGVLVEFQDSQKVLGEKLKEIAKKLNIGHESAV
jgi:hypothetical protein